MSEHEADFIGFDINELAEYWGIYKDEYNFYPKDCSEGDTVVIVMTEDEDEIMFSVMEKRIREAVEGFIYIDRRERVLRDMQDFLRAHIIYCKESNYKHYSVRHKNIMEEILIIKDIELFAEWFIASMRFMVADY